MVFAEENCTYRNALTILEDYNTNFKMYFTLTIDAYTDVTIANKTSGT